MYNLVSIVACDQIACHRGAEFEVEQIPIKGACKSCQHVFMVQDYKFLCPECESKDVDVLEGMELAVKEIEIE